MTYLSVLHAEEETRGWVRGALLRELEVWVAGDVGFAALADETLEHLYVTRPRRGADSGRSCSSGRRSAVRRVCDSGSSGGTRARGASTSGTASRWSG